MTRTFAKHYSNARSAVETCVKISASYAASSAVSASWLICNKLEKHPRKCDVARAFATHTYLLACGTSRIQSQSTFHH